MTQNSKNKRDVTNFVMHASTIRQMAYLTIQEKGILMTLIAAFMTDGTTPSCDEDRTIRLVFEEWRIRFEEDKEKYDDVSNKRAEAGRRGMQKRWGKHNATDGNDKTDTQNNDDATHETLATNPDDTTAMNENTDNKITKIANAKNAITKITDTDTDSDSDTDSDTDTDSDSDINKKETIPLGIAKKKISLTSSLEGRTLEFYNTMLPFRDKYDSEMLNDFYQYWTELDKRKCRMRFELQKTWETGKRLSLWARKSFK